MKTEGHVKHLAVSLLSWGKPLVFELQAELVAFLIELSALLERAVGQTVVIQTWVCSRFL